MKTIVISAVNLIEAGTLAILKDCLKFLSQFNVQHEYRIVAIVYKKELVDFPNIEYIETQWPKKRWINRLWYEYVSMKKISKDLGHIDLWFSLHDTTPTVIAEKRAVYCHNSFSFYKWSIRDLFFAPKIALFAIFTKYIYKTNIRKNDFLVVQQEWFRKGMSTMFNIPSSKIIVAPPAKAKVDENTATLPLTASYSFLFAGSPNSHKNFEIICQAVEILTTKFDMHNFDVYITVKGNENKYAKWLYKRWGTQFKNIHFIGFISKQELYGYYEKCHCLIFPSKVETWGLPISEFAAYHKPMLLADLPYTKETAGDSAQVAFFNPNDANQLANDMKQLIEGNTKILTPVPKTNIAAPISHSWDALFQILLASNSSTK
ncbi:glycosyltransferase family 4 protein [Sphingobacterium sp. SRCM116780]|uniref:glycosyltransferase family 4 protein n=1 Tax=Sphingobacterium sp. SRCM116780 TaxID=2907623 RepID=UPI001F434A5D|nr:glycosyltransferase family 1 protein [Sphingobacterium sp. SRCM116780]UIR55999.1 glycosyltransferase family 4 protein [Sphingobacterium sp. SRCM116780]